MEKLKSVFFFSFTFLMSSCGFYNPNLRNSPMLTKAGEVQASAQVGRGFEAQGAAAITSHVAMIANYMYHETGSRKHEFEKRTFGEAGLGYYKNDGISFYEIFCGFGRGDVALLNQHSHVDGGTYSETGKFNRYFIQPGIGYRSKIYSVSFAPRFSYVEIFRYQGTRPFDNPPRSDWYFEPACVNRLQLHHNAFITFQTGLTLGLRRGTAAPLLQLGGGVGFRINAQRISLQK